MLLLEEAHDIIAGLPVDSSPALCRLLRNQSSMSSLQAISADIDLPLSQVSDHPLYDRLSYNYLSPNKPYFKGPIGEV